jgi:type 1 glutamine amidotransferase
MRRRTTRFGFTILAAVLALGFWAVQARAQARAAQPQPKIAPGITAGAAYGSPGDPPAPKKHILILGFTEGFHHGSTSDGIGTIWQLGNESGLFDAEIRTDTKWISKGNVGSGEAHNLDWYDAIVAVNTTGTWQLTDQQKKDFISAIRDDGKGFVAAHAALDCNHNGVWPEFTEMLGGEFAAHPWIQFWAPVIIEDPSFPAMRHFPSTRMVMYDEMYVARADTWSRSNVNVLMRLNEDLLPAEPGVQQPYASYQAVAAAARAAAGGGARAARGPGGPGGPGGQRAAAPAGARPRDNGIHPDKDYALAWSKMYGKGRVFYSTLGHTKLSWTQPDVQKHYLEAIKWVLGLTEGSTASHPKVN